MINIIDEKIRQNIKKDIRELQKILFRARNWARQYKSFFEMVDDRYDDYLKAEMITYRNIEDRIQMNINYKPEVFKEYEEQYKNVYQKIISKEDFELLYNWEVDEG